MSASISADGKYRYLLTRRWDPDERKNDLVFCMLNPSTADSVEDDPTIRRCIGFAKREGCGGIQVVNLLAYRATDPNEVFLVPDARGPENFDYLRRAAGAFGRIVCAWGAQPNLTIIIESALFEFAKVMAKLYCLGRTKAGHPRHPLYVRADQPLERWPA
jgi:hypothetical protein